MTHRSRILATLLLSLPMVAGLLGAAPNASAQTKMTATIPFAFSIGNHRMAAGSYSVERMSDCYLVVHNNKTSQSRVLIVRHEEGNAVQPRAHLVFQRQGERMYLTQAWFAGTNDYAQAVAKPKRDLEYAKNPSPAGTTIEVASK
ncbi:MAG TPA: hypothetical protein VGM02_09725 [Acidobacteriaceae bacterium]